MAISSVSPMSSWRRWSRVIADCLSCHIASWENPPSLNIMDNHNWHDFDHNLFRIRLFQTINDVHLFFLLFSIFNLVVSLWLKLAFASWQGYPRLIPSRTMVALNLRRKQCDWSIAKRVTCECHWSFGCDLKKRPRQPLVNLSMLGLWALSIGLNLGNVAYIENSWREVEQTNNRQLWFDWVSRVKS